MDTTSEMGEQENSAGLGRVPKDESLQSLSAICHNITKVVKIRVNKFVSKFLLMGYLLKIILIYFLSIAY